MTNQEKFIEVMNTTFGAGFTKENMNKSCSPCGAMKELNQACSSFTCDGCKRWWDKEWVNPSAEICRETSNAVVRINLNEIVKFKLTDLGKDIFYRQYDEVNDWIRKRGGRPIEPTMPKVDADGYTEMQLWEFMEVFGSYFGMAKPNVINPLEVIYKPEQ